MIKEDRPSLSKLLHAAANGELLSAPPYEISKPMRKTLASTGYLVERFLAACHILSRKVQEERFVDIRSYFVGYDFSISLNLQSHGLFVCPLHRQESHLKLEPLILQEHEARQTLTAWHKVQLDAQKVLPGFIHPPLIVNAPLWPALLHLTPLRSFWEQELRRNQAAALLERLPSAWILDPTSLPPGAVIPKLEITSWQQLIPSNSFTIKSILSEDDSIELDESLSSQEWKHSIHNALQDFHTNPKVLNASTHNSNAFLMGIYQRQNQRVDLIGGVAIYKDDTSDWRLGRW